MPSKKSPSRLAFLVEKATGYAFLDTAPPSDLQPCQKRRTETLRLPRHRGSPFKKNIRQSRTTLLVQGRLQAYLPDTKARDPLTLRPSASGSGCTDFWGPAVDLECANCIAEATELGRPKRGITPCIFLKKIPENAKGVVCRLRAPAGLSTDDSVDNRGAQS